MSRGLVYVNIFTRKKRPKGSFINHVATKGGRGGRKSPKIGYVIGVKLATLGGRGVQNHSKNGYMVYE